jgi:hypothetical protein
MFKFSAFLLSDEQSPQKRLRSWNSPVSESPVKLNLAPSGPARMRSALTSSSASTVLLHDSSPAVSRQSKTIGDSTQRFTRARAVQASTLLSENPPLQPRQRKRAAPLPVVASPAVAFVDTATTSELAVANFTCGGIASSRSYFISSFDSWPSYFHITCFSFAEVFVATDMDDLRKQWQWSRPKSRSNVACSGGQRQFSRIQALPAESHLCSQTCSIANMQELSTLNANVSV